MSDNDYSPVKFLRLKNGDDVISEVVEIGDEETVNYLLIYPLKALYVPVGNREYVHISFIPWIFSRMCDKQEFSIDASDVITIADASENMTKYYWESIDHLENPEAYKEEEPQADEDGLDQLKEVLEQLGIDGKRTLH